MPKPDSLQGSLDLLVLKLLARRDSTSAQAEGRCARFQGMHGYAIMTAIREMSEEVLDVEEGSLYPALHRMEEAGWLKAEWTVRENGRRSRVYQITATGRKQLGLAETRWQAVTAAVNRILKMA
jgi:transcriptional regulator